MTRPALIGQATAIVSLLVPGAVASCPSVGGGVRTPDMAGQARTEEATWQACQQRCQLTSGCGHFAFWPDGGCNLQDSISQLMPSFMPNANLVVHGPARCDASATDGPVCPGSFSMQGYGKVDLVPTGWGEQSGTPQVGALEVSPTGDLTAYMNARAYFANTCTEGAYDHTQYLALNLLGKKMRYSVDISDAGCGCNVAFYMTSMRQNEHPSECSDYYCDANNVCGESCAEIDIQEANKFAWHSTLHSKFDHGGKGVGFGGGDGFPGPRDFTSEDYGPGARCVDTSKPFDVEVSFPLNASTGLLDAMEVKLSQAGSPCPVKMSVGDYGGMEELTKALKAGMTPIVSYWSSSQMLWMDGEGADHQGPCLADIPSKCGETTRLWGFAVEDIAESAAQPGLPPPTPWSPPLPPPPVAPLPPLPALPGLPWAPPAAPPVPSAPSAAPGAAVAEAEAPVAPRSKQCAATEAENCKESACCKDAGMQCYEKHEWWSACRVDCEVGDAWDPWSCKTIGARTAGTVSTKAHTEQPTEAVEDREEWRDIDTQAQHDGDVEVLMRKFSGSRSNWSSDDASDPYAADHSGTVSESIKTDLGVDLRRLQVGALGLLAAAIAIAGAPLVAVARMWRGQRRSALYAFEPLDSAGAAPGSTPERQGSGFGGGGEFIRQRLLELGDGEPLATTV